LSTVSNIYGGTGWTSPCTCYLDGSLIRQGLSRTDMFVQGVGGVLHGDAGSVTLYLEVTNPGDVGMVLAGSESGLSLEGFQILGVVSDRLVDNLDGDDTV